MSDVWRAAVSIDSVSIVSGAPEGTGGSAATASRILTTLDTVSGMQFGLQVALEQEFGDGSGDWKVTYYPKITGVNGDPFEFNSPGPFAIGWQQIVDPGTGLPLTIVQPGSSHGASFLAGGTIAITKDFDAGHLLFETPLGNMTAPFSWFAAGNGENQVFTPDAQPMYGNGMGHRFNRVNNTVTQSEVQKWYDFFTTKNGVQVFGWALSAGDPGSWGPWIPQVYTGETAMVTNDGQEATRYRTSFTWTLADDTPLVRDPSTSETRYVEPPAAAFGLDLAEMREHNIAWGAWTPSTCTCIRVRRSHDDGHTWTETVAVNGTDTVTSPSLAPFGGAVYLAYYDETTSQSLQTVSRDAGLSWSTPVPISITGSNPRLVISPEGVFFYFYISGSDIVLQRSMDLGATLFDASPITVAAVVPAQEFGAIFAADRSLLVAYADSLGNWRTRRSLDYGLTWADA